jgi:putative Mn2+ efflux pump MntP
MPLLGWYFGTTIEHYVETYAHWLAFVLLFLVGGNMIREAFELREEEHSEKKDATKGLSLVILSVATSIDALAVGLSMSLLNVAIIYPAVIIGIVAGIFTIAGLHLGARAAALNRISPVAEVIGGLVLWAIGLNILREHGVFTTFL